MRRAAPSPPQDAAVLADEAVRLLGDDPHRARALAQEALDAARATGDRHTAAVALRALGLATLDLEGAPQAVAQLRAAVAAARRAGCGRRITQSRMSLAHALQHAGRSTAALRRAGLAMAIEEAAGDGRLHQQHALILERSAASTRRWRATASRWRSPAGRATFPPRSSRCSIVASSRSIAERCGPPRPTCATPKRSPAAATNRCGRRWP